MDWRFSYQRAIESEYKDLLERWERDHGMGAMIPYRRLLDEARDKAQRLAQRSIRQYNETVDKGKTAKHKINRSVEQIDLSSNT